MPAHPWQHHYPADMRPAAPAGTVHALLAGAAARWGDKPALEYRDRRVGFAELAALVDRLASGFLAEGIGAGDRVALFLPNTPWHAVSFFAALRAGATVVHLSPLDAPRELAFKLADSGARLLIATDLGGMDAGARALQQAGRVDRVLIGEDGFWTGAPALRDDGTSLSALLEGPPPAAWPAVRPGDVALLQYTGGTTGLPKGAMLTHANLTAAIAMYQTWRDGAAEPGTERVIAVLPMFHVYALGVILLLGIAEGSEILLRPRFDVPTTLRDIEEKRATSLPAVPTMLVALLGEPTAAGRDFSSLRLVGSGGAPLPQEVGSRIETLLGTRLRTGWGMTETAAIGTRVPAGVPHRPGLIGVPMPGLELRIVSLAEPTRALPPGEVGEIAIRGPNVFGGYWNRPEDDSFADGWFLTGDIGRMGEDGLFTIVDRKKRMIISGGFNVYPAMIENAIYEHAHVAEAIVIGVPDPYRGEAAKAFVVLRPGAPMLTLEALREFLAERVGKHEMPAHLEIRPDLPKSPVGKLLAQVLIDEERARRDAA